MPRVPAVRKADLDRAIKALKDAGYEIAEMRVLAGGEVKVVPTLTGAKVTPMNALDRRRAERAQRAPQRA